MGLLWFHRRSCPLLFSHGPVAPRAQCEPAHLLLGEVQVPEFNADLPEEDVLPEALLTQDAQTQFPLLEITFGNPVVDQLQGTAQGKVKEALPERSSVPEESKALWYTMVGESCPTASALVSSNPPLTFSPPC